MVRIGYLRVVTGPSLLIMTNRKYRHEVSYIGSYETLNRVGVRIGLRCYQRTNLLRLPQRFMLPGLHMTESISTGIVRLSITMMLVSDHRLCPLNCQIHHNANGAFSPDILGAGCKIPYSFTWMESKLSQTPCSWPN